VRTLSNDAEAAAASARISGLYETATLDSLRPYAGEAESLFRQLKIYREAAVARVVARCDAMADTDLAELAGLYGGRPSFRRGTLTSLVARHTWGNQLVALAEPVPGIYLDGSPYRPADATLAGWYTTAEHALCRLSSQAANLRRWPALLRSHLQLMEKAAFAFHVALLPPLSAGDTHAAVQELASRRDLAGVADIYRALFTARAARGSDSSPAPTALTMLSGVMEAKNVGRMLRYSALRPMLEEPLRRLDDGEPVESVAKAAISAAAQHILRRSAIAPGTAGLVAGMQLEAAKELIETTRCFLPRGAASILPAAAG
jgi:hypothetical protein